MPHPWRYWLLLPLALVLLGQVHAQGTSRARWIDLYETLYAVTREQRQGMTPFEGTLEFPDDSQVVSWKDSYTLFSLLTMYRATGERDYLRRFTARAAEIYPGYAYRRLTSERPTTLNAVANGDFETLEDFSAYTPLPVIANGDFSAANPLAPTLPAHWTPWSNSVDAVALAEEDPVDGRYVTVRTNPAAQWQILEQPIAYTPGMLYGVSGFARTTDPVQGARIEVYDYTARKVLAVQYCRSTNWTRISFAVRMPEAGHNVRLRLYHGHYNVEATDAFDRVALCDPYEMGVLGYHDLPGWTRVNATPATAHLLPRDGGELPPVTDFNGQVKVSGGAYRLQLRADPGNGPQAIEQAFDYDPGVRYGLRGYGKAARAEMAVVDHTTGETLAAFPFTGGWWREGVVDFLAPAEPGHHLALRLSTDDLLADAPAQFDTLVLKRHYPHLVHEGQLGTALAEFVLLVRGEAALAEEFGATAEALLSLITEGILPHWEPLWRDLADGRGTYIFPADTSNGYNNQSLPYNEQLALGRVFILLYLLDGCPQARERAERMARTARDALRLEHGAYQWHYWDDLLPADDRKIAIEGVSHGNLVVHFADLACRAGIVFTEEDMRRFAATFLTRIWNGSYVDPRLNVLIDGTGDFSCSARRNFARWTALAAYDSRVRRVAETIFARNAAELQYDLAAYPHRASFFALSVAEVVRQKPFTRVSLAVSPVPAVVGQPVTLSATVDGIGAEYRFFVSAGAGWTELRPYGAGATCAWTPAAPGNYTLLVWAREVGSPNGWDAYATRLLTAEVLPLRAVSLDVAPGAPYTLTATPTGGTGVEYRFLVSAGAGWTEVRRYAAASSCAWTPPAPGMYTLLVWAREAGKNVAWEVYATRVIAVDAPPLRAVSLDIAPGAPYTLTATPTGGTRVEYRFFVSAGAGWTELRRYGADPTCAWTPPAPGNYTLLVWARETGNTTSWDAYATRPFTAPPP